MRTAVSPTFVQPHLDGAGFTRTDVHEARVDGDVLSSWGVTCHLQRRHRLVVAGRGDERVGGDDLLEGGLLGDVNRCLFELRCALERLFKLVLKR